MSPELLDTVLLQTDFPDLQLHASGKVRDVYQLAEDRLLFVATDRISAFDYALALRKYADQLRGRSMLVQRAEMFPVECVGRGYISGSAWKEYKATGKVCGIELPAGL